MLVIVQLLPYCRALLYYFVLSEIYSILLPATYLIITVIFNVRNQVLFTLNKNCGRNVVYRVAAQGSARQV